MVTGPGFEGPCPSLHFVPGWLGQVDEAADAPFEAATVFSRIRHSQQDERKRLSRVLCSSSPGLARQLAVVDRIDYDAAPQNQVHLSDHSDGLVGRDCRSPAARQPRSEHRVLDRVDGHVNGMQALCSGDGDGGLSSARESRYDDDHPRMMPD
jgi:hypothetical protein